MPDRPAQRPASTSDARKRAAENLATPDWGSDLREPLDLDAIKAEFIAHARTDVPALLAEVERLRGAVKTLASTLTHAQDAMIDAAGGRKACSDGPEIDWDVVYARLADLAAAREALARVEALADEAERADRASLMRTFDGGTFGAWVRASDIRAALAQPATDEGADQ